MSALLTKGINQARLLKSFGFAGRLFHMSIVRCEKKYLYDDNTQIFDLVNNRENVII